MASVGSQDILSVIAKFIPDSVTWIAFSKVNRFCRDVCKTLLKDGKLPNGLLHGPLIRTVQDGWRHEMCNFNGKKNGIFRIYHPSGWVFKEIEYKNGRHHGRERRFHDDEPHHVFIETYGEIFLLFFSPISF